jgi:hypothetical protein
MQNDIEYFESYDSIHVHNLMLRDEPRLDKYKEAIMRSKDLFKDKVWRLYIYFIYYLIFDIDCT